MFTSLHKPMRIAVWAFLMVGCSTLDPSITDRGHYLVNTDFPSPNQDSRVKSLVMHYTAADDNRALQILTQGSVSVHYLVPTTPVIHEGKPTVLQLVPEARRAWHAGVSNWHGRRNLNDSSVGIEIVNLGFTDTLLGQRIWYPFNENQIAAVAALAKDIIKRHHITPDNVLGHSDIAPLRKSDPGKLFPWQRLAEMGIGAWPDNVTVIKFLAGRAPDAPADILTLQQALHRYGYDNIPQNGVLDEETRMTFSAFQMHFRPANISGNPDAQTEAIANALNEKYRAA